jgi:nucleoid-associated protein YgaU
MPRFSKKERYMDDRLEELKDIETQRSDIITKLGKIEEKKHTVSTEVYEKVKKEYEDKLQTLNGKMTEHIDLIKDQLREIDQEEQTIVETEKDINIHLEELELRFSIGEFSEEEYNSKKDDYQIKLKSVKDKKHTLGERKSWLGNFIGAADDEAPVEPTPEPTPEVTSGEIPAEIPEAELEPIKEEEPEEIPEADLEPIKEDEQPEEISEADLEPIKEDEQPEEISEENIAPVEEAPAEAPSEGIQIEEHILEEKLPDEDTKLPELIVEEETVPDLVTEMSEETAPSEETIQEETPQKTAPAPATEKDKAIACPKCNHPNTPDSWYCEKCGAEILDSPIS